MHITRIKPLVSVFDSILISFEKNKFELTFIWYTLIRSCRGCLVTLIVWKARISWHLALKGPPSLIFLTTLSHFLSFQEHWNAFGKMLFWSRTACYSFWSIYLWLTPLVHTPMRNLSLPLGIPFHCPCCVCVEYSLQLASQEKSGILISHAIFHQPRSQDALLTLC